MTTWMAGAEATAVRFELWGLVLSGVMVGERRPSTSFSRADAMISQHLQQLRAYSGLNSWMPRPSRGMTGEWWRLSEASVSRRYEGHQKSRCENPICAISARLNRTAVARRQAMTPERE